ncbi:MAG: MetQ/NlpA family ABC transporter substrate-binding protein [Bacillota bacterium]
MTKLAVKILSLFIVFAMLLTGCTVKKEEKILRIGATPVPHVDLLKFVEPKLNEQGIKLEIVEFNDYVTPNISLAEGSTDANLFQHLPYMENFSKEHDMDLVALGRVNLNPMGLYSNKIADLKDIQKGSSLALPNDPINEARALQFLAVNGLLKLREGVGLKAGVGDVTENPHGFEFKLIEAAQLPRSLDDVDLAIVTGNYALGAGMSPLDEALVLEDTRSEFPNVLATRSELKDDERLQILLDLLQSKEMVEFMKEQYKGGVVPGFEVK